MKCVKTGADVLLTSHNLIRHGDLFITNEGTYILRATKELIGVLENTNIKYTGFPAHIFEDNQDTIIFEYLDF